jgi:hypothetical protein
VKKEGPLALYKGIVLFYLIHGWVHIQGLGAVISGIVPKMAIRFSSFELYKSMMESGDGSVSFTLVCLFSQT